MGAIHPGIEWIEYLSQAGLFNNQIYNVKNKIVFDKMAYRIV